MKTSEIEEFAKVLLLGHKDSKSVKVVNAMAKAVLEAVYTKSPSGLVAIDKKFMTEYLGEFSTRANAITADHWWDFLEKTAEEFCKKFASVPVKISESSLDSAISKVFKPSCTCNNGSGIFCVGCFYKKDLIDAIISLPELTVNSDEERIKKLREALKSLINSYRGNLSAFDDEIRSIVGNTNMACAEFHLKNAEQALSDRGGE